MSRITSAQVQETIRYATNLQLRASAAERQYRVEQVIKRSGLDGVRKSKVGSAVVRGVSGGEKRRLSIAVEVAAPAHPSPGPLQPPPPCQWTPQKNRIMTVCVSRRGRGLS